MVEVAVVSSRLDLFDSLSMSVGLEGLIGLFRGLWCMLVLGLYCVLCVGIGR